MIDTFNPTVVDKQQLQLDKKKWIATVMNDGVVKVFAYGSLMWNPDCTIASSEIANLSGYHRNFCLYSYMYRGNLENLGLVLGLKAGGNCDGIILELCPSCVSEGLSQIWDREMVTGAYIPIRIKAENSQGKSIVCHTFIARTSHNQWAGDLTPPQQSALIYNATGKYGNNKDYLYSTFGELIDLDIDDPYLAELVRIVKTLDNL